MSQTGSTAVQDLLYSLCFSLLSFLCAEDSSRFTRQLLYFESGIEAEGGGVGWGLRGWGLKGGGVGSMGPGLFWMLGLERLKETMPSSSVVH